MRLEFVGAAHTVTGSCYFLEVGDRRFLVDCGMFQGARRIRDLNYEEFPFRPADIEAVLLTHAHVDHCGLIPKLVKDGFQGDGLCDELNGRSRAHHVARLGPYPAV